MTTTTVTLHAGTVTLDNISALPDYGLVGSGALWDDASDATWFASKITKGSGSGSIFPAKAPLDALTLPTGAAVSAVIVHVRGDSTVTGSDLGTIRLIIQSPTDGFDVGIGPTYLSPAAGGARVGGMLIGPAPASNYSATIDGTDCATFGKTFDDLIASLTAGGSLYIYTNSPDVANGHTAKHRLYEVSVDVVYDEATVEPPPAATVAPPLRQYPRSDGLGASSVRRLWPPPSSIQASNRRAGGYL